MSIVSRILTLLFPERKTTQYIESISLTTLGDLVRPTILNNTEHVVTALLPYKDKRVRGLIVEAKFHESRKACEFLGTVLSDYLVSLVEENGFVDSRYIVVPVPLSKRRFRERGYNQVEKIVREALTMLPDSFSLSTTVLKRVRDTPPQTSLTRVKRLENMNAAFAVSGSLDPAVTYIVVDDVTTTGATLQSACSALAEVGATVEAVALAH